MACIEIPTPVLPTLPGGLSLGVTLPGASFDVRLCCKILPFPAVVPPIPFSLPISPAFIATINSTIKSVQDYLDALAIPCPKE